MALAALLLLPASLATPPPHLFMFIVDDLGWANVGWNRETPTPEVRTPTMDGLVAEGIELQRHYVFSCCSPSRASVLSGRLPPHVETWLTDPSISNPADTESGWAGIPRSMTGIAKMLKQANYSTAAVGKWDAGMATPQHTPKGRGFDSSLIYYHHANDYWTRQEGGCTVNTSDPLVFYNRNDEFCTENDGFCTENDGQRPTEHLPCIDLWTNDGPARTVNASAGDTYEEYMFKAEALRVCEKIMVF